MKHLPLLLSLAVALPALAADTAVSPDATASPAPAKNARRPKRGERRPGQPDPLVETLLRVIRDYVQDQTEEEGGYLVEDEATGRSWQARLLNALPRTFKRLSDNRARLSVLFGGEPEGGEGKGNVSLEVDFTLVNEGEDWTVEDSALRKVGDTALFAYDKTGARVPVKPRRPAR